MKTLKYMPVTLAILLSIGSVSFAQQPAATPRPTPDYVTEKGFKSRIFDVKYRDATNLANVLRSLGSGFRGATVQPNSEFKTITVRDFPENLATMEEAIKRLDTPGSPRPNIDLHLHVLIASNSGSATADMPGELRDVVTQLRGTLNFRNYELVASIVQRVTETRDSLEGSGIAELPPLAPGTGSVSTPYEYNLRNVALVPNLAGAATVQINEFTFETKADREEAKIQTALNIRDGEKVVVGTATIRNRALVIVLIAKLL